MSNKYWEEEEPEVVSTKNAELRHYSDAGRLQLFTKYLNKEDGEMVVGKGTTFKTDDMDSNEALALAYGFMRGLLDSGVDNDAFSEAFEILETAYNEIEWEEEMEEPEPEEPPVKVKKAPAKKEASKTATKAKEPENEFLFKGKNFTYDAIKKKATGAYGEYFNLFLNELKLVKNDKQFDKLLKNWEFNKKEILTFSEILGEYDCDNNNSNDIMNAVNKNPEFRLAIAKFVDTWNMN